MQNLPGYNEACRVLEKYLTPRAKALESLERYVEGTQYEGKPDWFSDTAPLWERAPCIVTPIVKSAIDSNGDLLLGEGRFPVVTVEGLEGEEANNFEKAVATVIRQSRFRAGAREVFAAGQGCGSACAIFGVRGGRLFIDTVRAGWCVPELDPEGAVLSIEIKYPFLKVVKEHGENKVVCKLYRRTIDATSDTTYGIADAREDGVEPKWTVATEIAHGLGFCPVVWFPHLRGCANVADFDGRAIHEHLTDEIRGHDFAVSQRHRAALYAGDPQWIEIGVPPGYNPTEAGRTAQMAPARAARPGQSVMNTYVSEPSGAHKARKKSPGGVWQYDTQDASKVKVELATLPGDALQVLFEHAKDLRAKLAEGLGVVFLDPESLPNESRLSGRALESFKARQLDRVDYYRSDFGDRFMVPALGMLLRIALVKKLAIESIEAVSKAMAADAQWSWHAPPLHFLWGDYFKPGGEEELALMTSAKTAREAGIATKRILVEKSRSILGVRDVDSYMEELEAEAEEDRKQEEAAMKLEASLKPKPAPAPQGKK